MPKSETWGTHICSEWEYSDLGHPPIKEVRDVSAVKAVSIRNAEHFREQSELAELAVFFWLGSLLETVTGSGGFPDLIAQRGDQKVGVEVKYVAQARSAVFRLNDTLYRSYFEVTENSYTEFDIILVILGVMMLDEVRNLVRRQLRKRMAANIHVIIGVLENERDPKFVPLEKFSLEELASTNIGDGE